jgi:hypothetical protein
MDTSKRQCVECCRWCSISGHFKVNCRNKVNGQSRKAQIGQESRQRKLVYYKCSKLGHIQRNCKVKNVEEGAVEENKEDSEYLTVQRERIKDGQSENVEVLPVLSNHCVLEDIGVCVPAPLSPKPELKEVFILENNTETKLVDVLSVGARQRHFPRKESQYFDGYRMQHCLHFIKNCI